MAEKGLPINMCMELACDDSILIERIEGRRIHTPSGRTYHTKFSPPKVEGLDDITNEPLVQRKDDTRQALAGRLEHFYRHTFPLLNFYGERGLLVTMNAQAPIQDLEKEISLTIAPLK